MNIRQLLPNELKQAAELSDLVFQRPGQNSMGKSFPALFHPGISHSYGAFTDEGSLVAYMGMAPDVIRIGGARLNVFSIGSVCTHPDYRGQNLASSLLTECKEHAIRSGASLIFVSGGRSLYRRAGCHDFGRIQYAKLDASAAAKLMPPDTGEWKVRPMKSEDTFGISRIISDTSPAYEQGPAQLLTLLGSSAISDISLMSQVTLVADKDSVIEAFLVAAVPDQVSSPGNEPARTVEWGGNAQVLPQLLAEMFRRHPVHIMVIPVPWQEQELLVQLQQSGIETESAANSGTVWIANAAALLYQCSPCLPVDWKSFIHIQETANGSTFTITKDNEELVLDDSGLLSLLFDPESPHKVWAPDTFNTIPMPYLSGLHYI